MTNVRLAPSTYYFDITNQPVGGPGDVIAVSDDEAAKLEKSGSGEIVTNP